MFYVFYLKKKPKNKNKKQPLIFPKFSRIFQELRFKPQFQETDRSFQAK